MNTQFSPYGEIVENLENYSDIVNWFSEVGLIQKDEKTNFYDEKNYYKEIINYRTLLRNSFKDYLQSNLLLDNLLEITNNILLESKVHPQIIYKNDSYVLEFVPASTMYNVLLTKIAIEVIKLLNSSEFKYLKKCDNHKCSLYFIDTSKNHSRRWCSMEICGNRSKVSNFTKRKKDQVNN